MKNMNNCNRDILNRCVDNFFAKKINTALQECFLLTKRYDYIGLTRRSFLI